MANPGLSSSLSEISLTVLLPMRNEEVFLERKINEVIEEIKNFKKTKLIVVNSSSDDNTKIAAVDALEDSVLSRTRWDVVDSLVPGKTKAVNLGLSLIETDLVMMMDTDAVSSPGWLKTCHEIFSDERIGMACGMEVFPSNRLLSSSELVYKNYSNNRRLSQSKKDSILIVEGSMCCFRKKALGGTPLNEKFNADDFQLAILCSKNDYTCIMDRRLTFTETNELTKIGSYHRRVRRGRGLFRNIVNNIGMALPKNNPVNPFGFSKTMLLYVLMPWFTVFLFIGITAVIIFPELSPFTMSEDITRIILILFTLICIILPIGRSFIEGCLIMLVAQVSSLTHSSEDVWIPDRQRE